MCHVKKHAKKLGIALLGILTAGPFAFSSVSAQLSVQPCLASPTDVEKSVEVRARKLASGSVEFGLRINGETSWEPQYRYFPYASVDNGIWAHSSECRLADGRLVAIRVRKLASGNVEFLLRINDAGTYSTWIPEARFLVYEAIAVNYWFSSSKFKIVDDLASAPAMRRLWRNGEFAPLDYDVTGNSVTVFTQHKKDDPEQIDVEAMLEFNRYFDYTHGNRFNPSKWVGIAQPWASSSSVNRRFLGHFINSYKSRDDIDEEAKVYVLNWDENDVFHLYSHRQPVDVDELSAATEVTMEEFERQILMAQEVGGNTTFDVKYDPNGKSVWRLYPHTVFWSVDMSPKLVSETSFSELWGVKAVSDSSSEHRDTRRIVALDPLGGHVTMSVEVVGMFILENGRLEFPRAEIESQSYSEIPERGGGIIVYVDIFDAETGRLLEQKILSTGENGLARFIVQRPRNGHDVVVQMSRGGFRSPYCRSRTGASRHTVNTRAQCLQEIISWDGDYVSSHSSDLEFIPLEE